MSAGVSASDGEHPQRPASRTRYSRVNEGDPYRPAPSRMGQGAIIIRVSGVRVPPPALASARRSGRLRVSGQVAHATWYQIGTKQRPLCAPRSESVSVPRELGGDERATPAALSSAVMAPVATSGTPSTACPTVTRRPKWRNPSSSGRGVRVAATPQRGAVLTKARELVQFARQNGYRREELVEMIQTLR